MRWEVTQNLDSLIGFFFSSKYIDTNFLYFKIY